MKKSQAVVVGFVAIWLGLGAGPAWAQAPQAPKAPPKSSDGATVTAQAELAPIKDRGRPPALDEQHKLLKSLAGDWELSSRTWKGAAGPDPILTKGSAEKRMILGDRFIQEDYHSVFQGQPYTGQGITGFDTSKQKFINTWVCNLSTGVIVSEGALNSSGRELVMTGTGFDHRTQQNKSYRMSMRIESNDKHTITYYETGQDGKEVKIVEVDYTRKK